MYIEKVELENFRGFAGKHEIVLHPELAVFAGVNGSGKSAVLDAVGSVLSGVVSLTQEGIPKVWYPPTPRNSIHVGCDYARWELRFKQPPRSVASLGVYFPNRATLPGSDTRKEFGFLGRLSDARVADDLPMMAYVHSSSSRIPRPHGEVDGLSGRMLAYRGAFDSEALQFSALQAWYEQEENLENQAKIELGDFEVDRPSLRAVRKALSRGIGVLNHCMLGKTGVWREHGEDPLQPAKGRLFITKGEKRLFIDQLSDGERRIVFLILDTARRMVMLNPHLEDPTLASGILAVDEVELHLHPQWQRNVVACLRAAFPKLQLLLSTHSPIVLSSVPNACVVLMGPGGVLAGKAQTYGRDPNTILAFEMDTPLHPAVVQTKLDALSVALNTNLRKAKKILKELEGSLGQDHPELVRSRAYLGLLGG
ncbi:MAG TPA: AAA family ATPase [Myxococcota bacterium]|nr:AAA family ATPase [Myxococcota bacterium]